MTQTWAMGIQSGVLSVDAAKKIWMTLVRSILEYGAEVWGGGEVGRNGKITERNGEENTGTERVDK